MRAFSTRCRSFVSSATASTVIRRRPRCLPLPSHPPRSRTSKMFEGRPPNSGEQQTYPFGLQVLASAELQTSSGDDFIGSGAEKSELGPEEERKVAQGLARRHLEPNAVRPRPSTGKDCKRATVRAGAAAAGDAAPAAAFNVAGQPTIILSRFAGRNVLLLRGRVMRGTPQTANAQIVSRAESCCRSRSSMIEWAKSPHSPASSYFPGRLLVSAFSPSPAEVASGCGRTRRRGRISRNETLSVKEERP